MHKSGYLKDAETDIERQMTAAEDNFGGMSAI